VPNPTLALTHAPFAPTVDFPTAELVDEVGGTWFEIWIPRDARHTRASPSEIVVEREAMEICIAAASDIPIDYEAALWRTSGALVLRATPLPDGYLVTSLDDRNLDVVRLVRHAKATLRVHVQVALALRSSWRTQSCAEALCASLQIR